MAADNPLFGIRRFAGEFIDEVVTKESINIAERKNRVGITKRVYAHDPTAEYSVKGGGSPPLALGYVASPGITGVSGGVFVVKERTWTDKSTDFDEFDLAVKHYPNATIGATA